MKTPNPKRVQAVCLIAFSLLAPVLTRADLAVDLQVVTKNSPSSSVLRFPENGTYHFQTAAHKVSAELPDGTRFVFDFENKLVSSLDPKQKTFYQMKMGDYLVFGEKLSPDLAGKFEVKTSVTLEPMVGQESSQILGHPVSPFDVYLGAHLGRPNAQGNSNPMGRRRRGGGGGFPGGGNLQAPGYPTGGGSRPMVRVASTGVEIAGELWLGDFVPTSDDRAELAVAECCTVLRGAPGLRGLTDRVKKMNRFVMGGDFSYAILDEEGAQPSKVPMVSIQAVSIEPSQFDRGRFVIPADFLKVAAPPLPLGTDL